MPNPVPPPFLSIIVPSAAPERHLGRLLRTLLGEPGGPEIIVVVDASALPSCLPPAGPSVRFLCTGARLGPAAARNLGAAHARGDILLFLDDDTLPAPGLPSSILHAFARHPESAAIYGSYDDSPEAPQLVSQFKNLQHHFVHTSNPGPSATFWAGCGAVRREVFNALGGFNRIFAEPSIEDIELGMRLAEHGYLVLLYPSLRVKHLKRWTLRSLLVTDHRLRALPWCRLLLERRTLPRQLNLGWRHRIGVLTAVLGLPCLLLAPLWPPWALVGLACWAASLGCQFDFLSFLARHSGPAFATVSSALILMYHLNAGLALSRALVAHTLRRAFARCRVSRPAAAAASQ